MIQIDKDENDAFLKESVAYLENRGFENIKADIVIYDIPFWYPHEQEKKGNLIDKNPPLQPLIEKIKKYITSNIIIFTPPDWKFKYFLEELGPIEYEQVYIDGKHNRNQIYLGELIKTFGKTKIKLNRK